MCFLFHILLFFSLIKKESVSCLPYYSLPHSINLLNGNILIIHSEGIVIYDSSLTTEIKTVLNNTNLLQNDENTLSEIEINRFSEYDNNEYIISIIYQKIYIFNLEGNLLYNSTNDENILNGKYYSLIPINQKNNEYIYLIGFIDKNKNEINLIFFKYNNTSNEKKELIKLNNTKICNYINCNESYKEIESYGLSCQLMSNFTEEEIIVCFINLKGVTSSRALTQFLVNPKNFTVIKSQNSFIETDGNIKAIKSVVSKDKKKSLVCYTNSNFNSYCSIYSIKNNSFSELKDYNIHCGGEFYYKFHLYYMKETNQSLFFCDGNNLELRMAIFDDNFIRIDNYEIKGITNIRSVFFIFSYNLSNYFGILSSPDNKYINFELNSTMKINITEKGINKINNNNANSTVPTTEQDAIIERLKISKDALMDEIPSMINKIEIGQIYKKIGEDFTLFIYPTNSTFLTSTTHVDFFECEEILRNHYHLDESSIITFLQIELENDNYNSLINQVEYQVYDENKNQLDLSLCKDVNIQIFYSIKNNSIIDLDSANSFKESGIDIFNLNDSLFNDICEPYSDNSDNDVILEDRIKYIYQNYSLCEDGCTYDKIDFDNMTIVCNCKVKENITTILTPIHLEHAEGSSTNFDVIKCCNLVFSLNGKLNNIGFWILGFIVIIHGPILVYYFYKGIQPVREYIINQMKEYGYIKNSKTKNNNNIKKKRKKIKKKMLLLQRKEPKIKEKIK